MSDLISRQMAIRWVKTECNPYGQPTLDYKSGIKVIEHLKRMPSAQPLDPCETCLHKGKGWDEEPCDGCTQNDSKYESDNGWIPVSERLPEGGHNIIFCDFKGNVCEGVYHAIPGQWVGFRWNAIYHHDDVVAWMPLPEPMKLEEDRR